MDLIAFNNIKYPAFQSQGNAAQFAIPYAKHFCKGYGVDIGYNNEEWKYPGAIGIDININYEAGNFPHTNLDYIFSSHCLEHIDNWVDILLYWTEKLKKSGIMFLYLPDYSQEYWRPWNNRKHKHIFTAKIIVDLMHDIGYNNIYSSGIDLNNSFMVVGEKG